MKIVHCFRSPVGGIFRHVRDLLGEQTDAGHEVGIICDSSTGGEYEDNLFKQIEPELSLGLYRVPMARSISPRDALALIRISRIIRRLEPDVVHSHSAKGGVYGRLSAKLATSKTRPITAFYCPHGGAMHYDKASLKGKVFFAAERFLERYTDSLIFISGYEKEAYHNKVGLPVCPETIVYNGLPNDEFEPVATETDAADFLYIGMMRDLKGPDIFLEAFRIAREKSGLDLTAMFVGDGEDKPKYIKTIEASGLAEKISVNSAMPARKAFSRAEIVVVPSRAESLPYLVLEAIAARKPVICTDVGGIHEIFGEDRNKLIPPESPEKLADAMLEMYHDDDRGNEVVNLAKSVKNRFSLDVMASAVEQTYKTAIERRRSAS